MSLSVRRNLEAEPRSVKTAREIVRSAAPNEAEPGKVDDLALLTSELVTNALIHGQDDIVISLGADGTTVRVEVFDTEPTQPSRRNASATATSGRGLHLLDVLAESWGVDKHPDGKTVWFEMCLTSPEATRR